MTPEDFRAEIARQQLNRYVLAAEVRVHPGRLGMMLNGKLPMPVEIAERIGKALSEHASGLAAATG
jgi:hypothetical protein